MIILYKVEVKKAMIFFWPSETPRGENLWQKLVFYGEKNHKFDFILSYCSGYSGKRALTRLVAFMWCTVYYDEPSFKF